MDIVNLFCNRATRHKLAKRDCSKTGKMKKAPGDPNQLLACHVWMGMWCLVKPYSNHSRVM